MDKVIIYSTPTCHFCHAAKDFFTKNGVAFEDINLSEHPERIQEMFDNSGQKGVPVIMIKNQVIVGFDEQRLREILGL